MAMSRREFLSLPTQGPGRRFVERGCRIRHGIGGVRIIAGATAPSHPNLLLIMVDQLQTPTAGI